MADKKKPGRPSGKHKSPRRPMMLPAEWLAIAQELAVDRQMPAMWYVVAIIKEKAEAAGREGLPPAPWEHQKEEK